MEFTDQEKEFLRLYEQNKDIYNAWGGYVKEKIYNKVTDIIKKMGISPACFFKISPQARLKEDLSLVQKAFHRNKNYSDPWNDITDKVGCRFVVLLLSDIKIVQKAIEDCADIWFFSHDRDFVKEKLDDPEKFAYQSQHYILKNIKSLNYDGVAIPPNTPCEVQIRTLMQHAYSELTHDTIYKSDFKQLNNVVRITSRCSALIESTDELFEQATDTLNVLNNMYRELLECTTKFIENNNLNRSEITNNEEILKKLICIWDEPKVDEYKSFLEGAALEYALNNPLIVNEAGIQILFFVFRYRRLFEKAIDELDLSEEDYEKVYVATGEKLPSL